MYDLSKQKKSQAALEFLTTYAWAFIVIAIVIAAIAYFGILKPSKILPDRCTFNVGFGCEAYRIDEPSTFNLRLKNGGGETITVIGMSVKADTATPLTCTAPTNPTNWLAGEIRDLTWTLCNFPSIGFVAGDKGKVLVTINYYEVKAGPTYSRTADGEVFAAVT